MNTMMQKVVFNNLLRRLEIQPAKEKSNAEKFYEWLAFRCKNKYVSNEEAMARAYQRIIEY